MDANGSNHAQRLKPARQTEVCGDGRPGPQCCQACQVPRARRRVGSSASCWTFLSGQRKCLASMAAVEYVPRVFAFEPAPAHRLSLPPLQGYTSADTSFALPPLNDGPSGSDRLLDSLQWRKKQSVTQQRSSSPSSKGKEPAQSPDQHVSLVPTEEAEGIDWLALHLEESEGKAATGQRRTFKVSSPHHPEIPS